MTFLIDDAFLLYTSPSGAAADARRATAVAGTAVADLVLLGRLSLDERKNPRVDVVDASPVGHPALDALLSHVHDRRVGRGARVTVGGLLSVCTSSSSFSSSLRLGERTGLALHHVGLLGYEAKRFGGLRPARFPQIDPRPEARIREELASVLRGGPYTARHAVLLSVLQATSTTRKLLREETAGLSGREIKARVASLECGGADVGPAIARAMDALLVAIMVPSIVAGATAAST